MSRIQVPTEQETNNFLTAVSGVNNLWSAINNFQQGNVNNEGWRSVQLMFSDLFTIAKEVTQSPVFKKIGVAVDMNTTYQLIDRLLDNIDKFEIDTNPQEPTYNNGYVGKTLIMDMFSDANAIAGLDLIMVHPLKS